MLDLLGLPDTTLMEDMFAFEALYLHCTPDTTYTSNRETGSETGLAHATKNKQI